MQILICNKYPNNILFFKLFSSNLLLFFKYILLIMLLQLSQFFSPLYPPSALPPSHPPAFTPTFSSRPWVVHISSVISPFPILFLTSPYLFCTYHLCLFPVPFSPSSSPSPLITLHVISISVILFLF